MIDKWDKRFLSLAKEISQWSKDPSTKIGAVTIGPNRRLLSTGYNGFPRGIVDTDERLTNRDLKYKYVVHGEMNCIYNATLNGVSLNDANLYVYGLPVCSECAKGIIQVGIKNVFMCFPGSISEKWKDSFDTSKKMFDECGIQHYVEVV